ncbi:MAG: hypothetical protein NXI04_13555 [Planctomycetaceae bacterium]|nr:hypothetical protein [Planctomycetaceae bacterium]
MSRDYLQIENFVQDAMLSRALHAAFDYGLIDRLLAGPLDAADCVSERMDESGARFLLQMLTAANVVTLADRRAELSDEFRQALRYRDLLQTKLKFAQMLAADYFGGMDHLLRSAEDFMAHSVLFDLFDYGNCTQVTPASCLQASRWMELTTMLTRYEAPVCAEHYAFDQHRQMLDVGGNSGEFALQVCRRADRLQAMVLDLPAVCAVGQRHLQGTAEQARVSFQPGNMLQDDFPAVDLVTWKSVLHDWPDEHAAHLLRRTYESLLPGGSILIFERQVWDFSQYATSYGLLPVFLFFRSYRTADDYRDLLQQAGFVEIDVQTIELEVPFLLATARRD